VAWKCRGQEGARAASVPQFTSRMKGSSRWPFHVLKRSGRADEQVLDELAIAVAEWQKEGT
jgi:hypothetical protein